MFRLILIAMIALLPFRSWASDAMGTHMAMQLVAPAVAAQVQADRLAHIPPAAVEQQSTSMADCHQAVVGQLSDDVQGNLAASNDHCNSCQACQACHNVAISPTSVDTAKVLPPLPVQSVSGIAYTSAAPALSQKPPIS